MSYILDNNVIYAVINGNKKIKKPLKAAELREQKLFISCITYYEVLGGLLAKNATRKLSAFNRLCNTRVSVIYLDSRDVLDCASQIYADLRRAGTPVGTPDILIAATAITRGLILVSHDRSRSRYAENSGSNPGITSILLRNAVLILRRFQAFSPPKNQHCVTKGTIYIVAKLRCSRNPGGLARYGRMR